MNKEITQYHLPLPSNPLERRSVRVMKDSFRAYNLEGTLDDLSEWVAEKINLYGADADLVHNYDYEPYSDGERYSEFQIWTTREETDEELAIRIEQDKKQAERQRQNDLAMLAELKKKLGEE